MLGKLLKYEFRSVSKLLVPITIGVLGLSIITSIIFNLKTQFSDTITSSPVINQMVELMFGLIVLVTILAFVAFAIVTFVALIVRFYKSLFTDEGYLSHTLPVTASQHLASKLIVASVWTVISAVVTCASILLFVFVGTASKGDFINYQAIDGIKEAFNYLMPFYNSSILLVVVQVIVLMLISIPASLLTFYLAITIGAIITKKHKVLAGIGIYIGINTALSFATSIINIIIMAVFGEVINQNAYIQGLDEVVNDSMWFANIYLFSNIFIYLILGITCFFICRWLITKKLNLA